MHRLLFGCMIFQTTRLRVMRAKRSHQVKKMKKKVMRRRRKAQLSHLLMDSKTVRTFHVISIVTAIFQSHLSQPVVS